MPKFSIIVPVYNSQDFINETLDNLLKQKVDKEILLINDGSTDNSENIIREYESNYDCIKVYNKKNGGVSSSRNFGLNVATGEYIIFCDSDDFIQEDLLHRCEIIFNETKVDSVFFTYKYCYNDGRPDIPHLYKPTGFYTIKDWIGNFYDLSNLHIINCIGTTIYKRSILEKNNLFFNEHISYSEDISFCCRYLANINFLYYINEPLYYYRIINNTSLIASYKPNFSYANDFRYQEQMFMLKQIFGEENIPEDNVYKVFADDILMCIDNVIKRNDAPEDQIHSEIKHLTECTYLDKCIKYTSNSSKRKKLIIIKNNSVDKSVIKLRKINQREMFFEKFFIIPLRLIYHKIR